MHKKRSKKRSKWRFLHNLRKYRTDFKNNGGKPCSKIGYILCRCNYPKGGAGAKNGLNYCFCVTEGRRNIKFEIFVTY